MSLSVSTAASGDSAMMRLVKALKPLGDRVLVRHLEQKTTRQVGSIVLPDSATEKIHQGVVIEVGPGARNPTTGIKFPMTVKKGDRVLLPDFTPTMFKVGNDKYGLYSEQDILCTLHDE